WQSSELVKVTFCHRSEMIAWVPINGSQEVSHSSSERVIDSTVPVNVRRCGATSFSPRMWPLSIIRLRLPRLRETRKVTDDVHKQRQSSWVYVRNSEWDTARNPEVSLTKCSTSDGVRIMKDVVKVPSFIRCSFEV